MKKAVIIVAGGSGTRMHSTTPKQFLKLAGKPVIVHAIEKFIRYDQHINIIVVLPAMQQSLWESIKSEFPKDIRITTAKGGVNRYESVKNGLSKLDNTDLVAIHDGVRPLVSQETIRRCFDEAARSKGAIPIIPVLETLRHKPGERSVTVDRNKYFTVQTPQVFRTNLIRDAYDLNFGSGFTDDASVFESAGHTVSLVEGNRENIKITTPMDMVMAEALLEFSGKNPFL